MNDLIRLVMCAVVASVSGAAAAQQPDPPPAAPNRPVEPERPPAELPGLDELLGLSPAGEAPGAEAERDELDRRLAAREAANAFVAAIQLMEDAVKRLAPAVADAAAGGGVPDTSVATQRVQEDVIVQLDKLIESIERQQQQSRSQSQSRSSSQQQTPRGRQDQQREQAGQGENTSEANPPGRQEGALRPGIETARAAWGNLPARVRDSLIEGSGERFSSLYERLTEAYYKRLAEEARP